MSFWSFELMKPIIESSIIHLVPCHCVHKTLSYRARKSCKQILSNFLAMQCKRLSRLRKQPAFRDFSTGFPTKWRLRNVRRNSILMTCHYTELGTAFDWLKQVSVAARPIRSTNLIWVVEVRHQNGISALVPQTSFRGETSGGIVRMSSFFSG